MIEIGNVVTQYSIGNTTITICDDAYQNKTDDDFRRIHDRIMSIARRGIEIARAAGKDV